MKITIIVSGMTCSHCEKTIDEALKEIKGIKNVNSSFKNGLVEIFYDNKEFPEKEIKNKLKSNGYSYKGIFDKNKKVKRTSFKDVFPIITVIIILYLIINIGFGFKFTNFFPTVTKTTPLIMLFAIGFLSSFHCIGMCGSINLIASVGMNNKPSISRPLLYNVGRIISYTITGAIVGAIGSVFSFNSNLQGIIIFISSLFILMMALSMLGWLPEGLYKLIPKLPTNINSGNKTPFIIGLLNGLMPCGPLQAMQLYALSTGSIWLGALSMFIYALGTVPLMFGFGLLFTKLKFKYNILIQRISSILILLLSLFMLNRAFIYWGIDLKNLIEIPVSENQYDGYTVAEIKDGKQYIEIELTSKGYTPIIVQKDIPVVFNIKVTNIEDYGCTNTVKIPKFDITKELQNGDNIIEFNPTEIGNITYTCWMGMVTSNIKVVDDISKIN